MHPDSVRGGRYAKQQKMKSPKGKKDLSVGKPPPLPLGLWRMVWRFPCWQAQSFSHFLDFKHDPYAAGVSPEPALALRQRQTALFPKWFAIYQLCVSERQDKGSGGKHPADFRMAVLQKGKRTPRRYCPAGLGFSPRSEWSSSRGPSAHPSWEYLRAEHRSRKRP